MRYWKRNNPDGSTNTVESYSHNLEVEDAIEISEEEFTIFIASLPVVEPGPVRDLAAEIDELRASLIGMFPQLTVEGFRYSAATGTENGPEYINDGDTTTYFGSVLGQYAQVIFLFPSKITQFRQFGVTFNLLGDKFKLQYQDTEDNWIDWVTNIEAIRTRNWGNWNSSGGEVIAQGIKLINTAGGACYMAELEVKY